MTIHSPSRSRMATFAMPGMSEETVDRINDRIAALIDEKPDLVSAASAVSLCVHSGLDTRSTPVGPVVHVAIDLPDIMVSPVLDAPGGVCTDCYRLRRRQHALDPRLRAAGSIDVFRPQVRGEAITSTIVRIVAGQVVGSIERWANNPNSADFCLYRVPSNHLISGTVTSYTNCKCAEKTPTKPSDEEQTNG